MAKNYYLILGVPIDAPPETIRSAFRKQARRYHPDHGGPANARAFREASEAYEVLSDPALRESYDREMHRSVRREPQPLVADPVPITGRPESARPSLDSAVSGSVVSRMWITWKRSAPGLIGCC